MTSASFPPGLCFFWVGSSENGPFLWLPLFPTPWFFRAATSSLARLKLTSAIFPGRSASPGHVSSFGVASSCFLGMKSSIFFHVPSFFFAGSPVSVLRPLPPSHRGSPLNAALDLPPPYSPYSVSLSVTLSERPAFFFQLPNSKSSTRKTFIACGVVCETTLPLPRQIIRYEFIILAFCPPFLRPAAPAGAAHFRFPSPLHTPERPC